MIDVGLRGLAASQAESSAWQAAWIAMSKPELRRAASPWGVLWRAAKRAALGEVVAARYGKVERRAWELLRPADGTAPVRLPLSLDVLLDAGWDVTGSAGHGPELQELTAPAIRGLIAVGWPGDDAARIVAAVIDLPDARDDPRSEALGWRHMATDLACSRGRRGACVSRYEAPRPGAGLFARVLSEGPQVVECPADACRAPHDAGPPSPVACPRGSARRLLGRGRPQRVTPEHRPQMCADPSRVVVGVAHLQVWGSSSHERVDS